MHDISHLTLDTEPGESLMNEIGRFLHSSRQQFGLLQSYFDAWKKVNDRIGKMYKALVAFVGFNLIVIASGLASLAFVPSLVSLPGLAGTCVTVCVILAGFSGFMIFLCLYRRRI